MPCRSSRGPWLAIALGAAGCGRVPLDADARPSDAGRDLPHVTTAVGWQATEFDDFSADHAYVATDFVDGAETYDNQPDGLFFVRPPYPEVLVVIAGRELLELSATGVVVVHDFGHPTPNQLNLPDEIIVSPTSVQLIRVASGPPYAETQYAERSMIRRGDGDPPAGSAWAVVDRRQLVTVTAAGELQVIAETTDPAYTWQFAAAPPAGHAFAGPTPRVYVLENNRARDLDRVIVVEGP